MINEGKINRYGEIERRNISIHIQKGFFHIMDQKEHKERRSMSVKSTGINFASQNIPVYIEKSLKYFNKRTEGETYGFLESNKDIAYEVFLSMILGEAVLSKTPMIDYTVVESGEVVQMSAIDAYRLLCPYCMQNGFIPVNILFPFLVDYGLTPRNSRIKKNIDAVHRGMLKFIDSGDLDGTIYKNLQDSVGNNELALHDALMLMFGAFDTTSYALSEAQYLLSKHPETVKELKAEIQKEIFDGAKTYKLADLATKLTNDKIHECEKLGWFLKEALRLAPPAP